MASVYKVKRNQNIFDVAVQIYGSIDGMFDLLMSNPELSIGSILEEGTELEYHESFIRNQNVLNALSENNIVVAHGNGNSAPIATLENTKYVLKITATEDFSGNIFNSFGISGNGTAYIDWGDGKVEKLSLTRALLTVSHNYLVEGVYKGKIYACSDYVTSIKCGAGVERFRMSVGNVFMIGTSLIGGSDVII